MISCSARKLQKCVCIFKFQIYGDLFFLFTTTDFYLKSTGVCVDYLHTFTQPFGGVLGSIRLHFPDALAPHLPVIVAQWEPVSTVRSLSSSRLLSAFQHISHQIPLLNHFGLNYFSWFLFSWKDPEQ